MKCAFDVGESTCSALTKKFCPGCRFFKTKEKLAEGRKKAMERVRRLPQWEQDRILDKYGLRPKGGMRGGRG